MPRPRSGKFACVNELHGVIFLSRDTFDEILTIADMEGYRRSGLYLGGQFKEGEILLWISPEKNPHTCKLQICGARKTVYFKSRRLARVAGSGRKPVKIHH